MLGMLIKKRIAKLSTRGVYIQDQQLSDTDFSPGTKYKYQVDIKKRQLLIVPSIEDGNTVSRRKLKTGIKPVIDIRNKEALSVFDGMDALEIEIFQDKVKITGIQKEKIKLGLYDKVKSTASKIFQFRRIGSSESSVFIDRIGLKRVVGDVSEFVPRNYDHKIPGYEDAIRAISLFSGAGILDQGFIEEGFKVVLAIEKNPDAVETYRHNHGDHIVEADIKKFNFLKLWEYKAELMFGGSPCQGLSPENRYTNFLDNPNNELINYFIEGVKSNPYCKVFVLENVPQILTAGNGKFKYEIYSKLSDFEITSGVINSAGMGDPQIRKRAIFIGSKIGKIDLPKEHISEDRYVTVREAFRGLNDRVPNQLDITKSRKDTLTKMSFVPPGGNWRNIPDSLKTSKMLSKNGVHSDIYKRLERDKPSITITNVRKTLLLHPMFNRILSVRECARLFSLPDTFKFFGSLGSKQQQLANAVPVKLAKSVAKAVMNKFKRTYSKGSVVPIY